MMHLYNNNLFKKQNYLKYLNILNQTQYYSEQEIYELKYDKIVKLLRFCSKHNPFYQELIERLKIRISNIKDIESFEEILPIITKSEIQKNSHKLHSKFIAYPPEYQNSTGGSTGNPLNFFQDRYYHTWTFADRLRHFQWCDWHLWEKKAYIWGSHKDYMNFKDRKLQGFRELVSGEIFLNSFSMDQNKMQSFYNKLTKFQPKILIGYANALNTFAQFLEKNNFDCSHFKFNIQSAAENLYPEMRNTIERMFQTNVFNSYGSREISSIAHECKYKDGLHISEEIRHVEIKKEKENSEIGHIILTDLVNYTFPFIRYQNEDIGEFSNHKCKCGRNLKRLKTIHGRKSDFMPTPSGKLAHSLFFTFLFYHQTSILDFQVIQDRLDHIQINYVFNQNSTQEKLKKLKTKIIKIIKKDLDHQLNVSFNEVKSIPSLASGKRKCIISNLDFSI
ncbi:hypothetical protein NEF87_004262 [Candidatus Lokiarchaeum ossiferum]|uniref:Phenylacetate--CoA ligase family protein n=1 Tax=Candidatus Lokiarchaeum ossiferum TaxID=2951803 RepID=A0ABY6I072_9ARCH|nr:hypothetical protein NEF87_004262 [Candidatus Lokiarchaeum sp. B-35]